MATLPFSMVLTSALEGPGAIPPDKVEQALRDVEGAQAWLKDQRERLELLTILNSLEDVSAARKAVEPWQDHTSHVAVLGIGGSSLGGQALKAIAKAGIAPAVSFHDNPDPWSWKDAMESFDLKTTRFVVISKSGGTAETLFQALTAADAIEKAGGGKYLKYHFIVITEPKRSALRDFAEGINATVLDHPSGIGGRYSALTVVGILPALLMGLDVEALREGARETMDTAMSASPVRDCGPAMGAALHHALSLDSRLNRSVLWAYADRFQPFTAWWRQLWAESLGKNGKGSTPVAALGPVDQHSQLQLFRDGPNDALYTIVTTATVGSGLVAPKSLGAELGLDYLAGRHMGDLVDAEARATAQTLARNARPVRTIHVPVIDERSIGALMMHFMLETILMGKAMGVDPFDQPGVEEGKVLARSYLMGGA